MAIGAIGSPSKTPPVHRDKRVRQAVYAPGEANRFCEGANGLASQSRYVPVPRFVGDQTFRWEDAGRNCHPPVPAGVCRVSDNLAERWREKGQTRLTVFGHEGINIDDERDSLGDPVGRAGHGHSTVAGATHHHIVEVLELEHRDDVLNVRRKSKLWSQVMALAHPRQRQGGDIVLQRAQGPGNCCPLPAAAVRAVDDNERRQDDRSLQVLSGTASVSGSP
jgi:hypothetical protein